MYRLYWDSGTGAVAPQVMFEELGIGYERIPVNIAAGENRSDAYLTINPLGQVPTLQLPEGTIVTESAAMVLLIGERHPHGGLVPGTDEIDRAVFLRWLLFLATAVYPGMLRIHHAERYTTDAAARESVRQAAMAELDHHFALLDSEIAGEPWLLGRGYSAVDIYLAMLADWHPNPPDLLQRKPALQQLCAAAEARPAFARVMAQHRS